MQARLKILLIFLTLPIMALADGSPYSMMGCETPVLDYVEPEIMTPCIVTDVKIDGAQSATLVLTANRDAILVLNEASDTLALINANNQNILRFMTMDPLANESPATSPYAYCMGDPINLIDPTGNIVIALNVAEQNMIRHTLPKDAYDYVKFDDKGALDPLTLLEYSNDGNSKNFSDLLEMALNIDYTVEVNLVESYYYLDNLGDLHYQEMGLEDDLCPYEGNEELRCLTGEWGHIGHTSYPGFATVYSNSTNKNIQVFVNSRLSIAGRAEAFSHEFYGHGYLYMFTRGNTRIASHRIFNNREHNTILGNKILKSMNETSKNMRRWEDIFYF